MALLNYTTTVSVDRTIAGVHSILVKAKARAVQTEYDDSGSPIAVAFSFNTPFGIRFYHLPINVDSVLAVLKRDRTVPNRYKTAAQAERVAWRIIKDWLEAQLAIIATEMVTLDQVMLPYMRADGRSVYELFIEQQLALPAST